MTRGLLAALGLRLLLWALPDVAIIPLFCYAPAWLAAAWFNAPLETPDLAWQAGDATFVMARSCSGETFCALAAAVLIAGRRWRWMWAAYPLTLAVNTLRVIAACACAPFIEGTRLEAAAHLGLGILFFLGALLALSFLNFWRPHHGKTARND